MKPFIPQISELADEYIAIMGKRELTEEELEQVAGGGKSYAKIMENVKLALEHDARISIWRP